MLEGCKSLMDCEKILSEKIRQARYIAQVELSREDLAILEGLIRNSINLVGPELTKNRLKNRFPFCTAFFMVYKGVWEYHSGNYWSCLSSLPDISNPNSQSRWGEWFLNFLKEHNLAEFSNIERTYRYVTPILIHGGMPQICIENFFEKIVVPLIEQGYRDREEVVDFLYSYRIRQKETLKIENLIHKLNERLFQLEKEKTYAEKLVECLNKLNESTKITSSADHIDNGLSLPDIMDFYDKKQRELKALKNDITNLETESQKLDKDISNLDGIKNCCFEAVNIISKLYMHLSYIEKSKREIKRLGIQKTNWHLCGNISISHSCYINRKRFRILHLNHILDEHNKDLKNYAFQLKDLINRILSNCSVVAEGYGFKLQYKDAAREIAASLEDSDAITREMFETASCALEEICIFQEKILNKVENSKNLLEEKIRVKQKLLDKLNSNINEMEYLCRLLGNGYFDRGLERIPEWLSSRGEIREEKHREIFLLKQEINKHQNNIRRLTCFVQYAEKTVQYFLYYGGDWSEQWLIKGVEMVLNQVDGEMLPDFEINDCDISSRFVSAFNEWWQKRIDINSEKTLRYSAARTGQHFTTPVLILDPVFGELKIIVGRQRILFSENSISQNLFVKIEDKNNPKQSVCIPVRCYRTEEEDLVETNEIEYNVEYISSNYVIVLGSESHIYKIWEISGIDINVPFMTFNLKGIHISGNVCPKGQAWILMKNEYEFKSDIPVLEEIIPPALLKGYRLMLADFTNVNSFSIGKKEETDSELVWEKVGIEDYVPYLTDASYIPGLKISGALVYNETLPELAVPVNDDGGLQGWSMVIRKGKRLRKYIRFSELNNENLYLNNGYALINLGHLFSFPEDLAGFYSIYLRNPMGEEFNFEFTYIPDLFVGFDGKDVHFPSDEIDKAQLTLIFSPGMSFTAEPPAVIDEVVDEAYDIVIPWDADWLNGEVIFNNGERFSFELELPNIKWKVLGLELNQNSRWNIGNEEIWIDDRQKFENAFLYIYIPSLFGNKARYYEVGIDGCDRYVTGKFTNNRAKIDLAQFSDTIGGSLKSYSFYIRIYDGKFKFTGEGILFNLRNYWEVQNLKWDSIIQEDKINLKIQWDDLGKAVNRVMQLWKCWEPWEPPLKYNIPDGSSFISIQEDREYLKEGKYLVKFDVEDPWDQPLLSDFPSGEKNVHFIEINGEIPWLKRWEFSCDFYGNIKICGSISKIKTGAKVECYLIGLVKGRPLVYKKSTELMDDGYFSVTIPKRIKAQKWAHWLVVKGVDIPFYHVSIVPDPSPVEIDICKNFNINVISWDLIKYVKITAVDQDGKSYKFTGNMARDILDMGTGEKDELDLKTDAYGKKQNIKLIYENSQYFLMIENGVKCTSCGAIVESQAVWNLEHYPRCNSFIYKYTDKIKVDVVAGIDSSPAVERLLNTYKTAGLDLLELYSNVHKQAPEWGDEINLWTKDRERLKYQIFNLIKREMELLKMSIRGGELDER